MIAKRFYVTFAQWPIRTILPTRLQPGCFQNIQTFQHTSVNIAKDREITERCSLIIFLSKDSRNIFWGAPSSNPYVQTLSYFFFSHFLWLNRILQVTNPQATTTSSVLAVRTILRIRRTSLEGPIPRAARAVCPAAQALLLALATPVVCRKLADRAPTTLVKTHTTCSAKSRDSSSEKFTAFCYNKPFFLQTFW